MQRITHTSTCVHDLYGSVEPQSRDHTDDDDIVEKRGIEWSDIQLPNKSLRW